ncbi:MAG: hypothetical protein LBQ23_03630 [Puniceicoccales bacterium]|jgi:hypothetical protein|nr:hypothetical protein [Puniceicoccales bacterium]
MNDMKVKSFFDYKSDASNWITLARGEYYPDILKDACTLYKPVLILFGQLVQSSESSSRLFFGITEISESWMRIQLLRIFKRYVCPVLPVEMTKRKTKAATIEEEFASKFRPINEVQKAFNSRPSHDEVMCALLWEYKDRGKKGYDLTERFFELFRSNFSGLQIIGPERAGKDILMQEIFADYPNANRPVDFVIKDKDEILAIGLARYDSDRGGTQEDDRTGGYANCANEFLSYTKRQGLKTKLIFINDGPGLLLGSMWNDYASLEKSWEDKIMVLTLRMVTERMTKEWLTTKI